MPTVQKVDMKAVCARLEKLEKSTLLEAIAFYQQNLLIDLRGTVNGLVTRHEQLLSSAIAKGEFALKNPSKGKVQAVSGRMSEAIQIVANGTNYMSAKAIHLIKIDQLRHRLESHKPTRDRLTRGFGDATGEIVKWASIRPRVSAKEISDALVRGEILPFKPARRNGIPQGRNALNLMAHIPDLESVLSGGVDGARQRLETIARGIKRFGAPIT